MNAINVLTAHTVHIIIHKSNLYTHMCSRIIISQMGFVRCGQKSFNPDERRRQRPCPMNFKRFFFSVIPHIEAFFIN